MDENERLRSIVRWRTNRRPNRAEKLGDTLERLMESRVLPQHTRFGPLESLWSQLLPEELTQHCELADFAAGQLKVRVDSPSYMHELRMCSPQLLEQLQRQCPQAHIKGIKLVIG